MRMRVAQGRQTPVVARGYMTAGSVATLTR
jgi:hypothetical protein